MAKLQTVLPSRADIHVAGQQREATRLRHPPLSKQLSVGPGLEHDARRRCELLGRHEIALRAGVDDSLARLVPLRPHVPCKVVEDGLPTAALLFYRMRGLAIERDADSDAVGVRHKIDLGIAVTEGICDPLVLDDVGINAGKVE